ncbi:hypothetical protein DHEL01_v209756 [Diaporthe helianthi]|uniref:Uncharacterized protein n=1 Tax=Diaporthe helianthi TaxID=158607 RepID=A0A2P5HNN0_DIAHE|nr:hypothetical protein DHEL01_v209756 [Diaporthe helianthi]
MLNGTVQEVYSQMLQINPNYETEFGGVDVEDRIAQDQMPIEVLEDSLDDDMDLRSSSTCGRFDPAREAAVWEGINHLNHVSGRPVSVPGPGVCGRMFTEKTLSSFNEIGASVQVLAGNCAYWSDVNGEPHISGQQSHVDRWRTIVKEADC